MDLIPLTWNVIIVQYIVFFQDIVYFMLKVIANISHWSEYMFRLKNFDFETCLTI